MPPIVAKAGRSRLSSAWTTPDIYEVLRIAPVAEFAGHRVRTLLLQPLSLIAQFPAFQAKRIDGVSDAYSIRLPNCKPYTSKPSVRRRTKDRLSVLELTDR